MKYMQKAEVVGGKKPRFSPTEIMQSHVVVFGMGMLFLEKQCSSYIMPFTYEERSLFSDSEAFKTYSVHIHVLQIYNLEQTTHVQF